VLAVVACFSNSRQPFGAYTRKTLLRTLVAVFALALVSGATSARAQSVRVNVNFANRSGSTAAIPPQMFGFNPVSLQDADSLKTVAQAGFTEIRRTPDLPAIYASTTPNWSSLDWTMQQAQTAGLHPLVVISRTPPWLRLSSNPCAAGVDPSHAPPTDASRWGELAASFVAHLDSKFPGLVQDFEIWNEPDLPASLCANGNTDLARLQLYLPLYAAAASAMRAQAEQDGVSIRIGGPAVSNPAKALLWTAALVSDRETATNVDFVSYHFYPTDLQFAKSANTWGQLFDKVQGAQGALDTYLGVVAAVLKGLQPHASSTPIYITEFNDGSAFLADCCRNNPTYGPLWNSVFLVDMLNSAFAHQPLPQKAYYYAGNSAPYFCLLGKIDSAMDCASGSTPYPQYYAYQLFAAAGFLGLKNGGHMAGSVGVEGAPNLLVTAFYTGSKDTTVIVNPTATAYSAVTVSLTDTGFNSPEASALVLDNSHPHIASQAITSSANGETATVAVPAYSTVAVSWSQGAAAPAPPVASLSVTPASGTAPLHVSANSSASYDPNGSIASRVIDFGDGSASSSAAIAAHTYARAGTYHVELTVTNEDGVSATKTSRVTATAAADFILAAGPSSSQGAATDFRLTITRQGTLSAPVSFSCLQVPEGKECSFSPNPLSVNSATAQAVLSVAPTATSSATTARGANYIALAFLLGPAALLLAGDSGKRKGRKLRNRAALAFLALALLASQLGCGDGASRSASTTGSEAQFVIVQASSGGRSHTLTVSLNR